ncbi:MAG: phosphate ABC transporter substrate-binding protein [Clostridium sp.]|nr:phosphate ABC transporter substrate-binding protein [Clostridium sp.]
MKKSCLRKIISLIMVASNLVLLSCSSDEYKTENSKITISGSTSVGPLMEKMAEDFEKLNEGVVIEVNQTGSSAGIKDVIDGVSKIGMSSRDLSVDEEGKVEGIVMAYDGIAVIVNNENPIINISKEEVKDIFTGKITNWKDVGGEDSEIVVVSREDGSGTRAAFEEIVEYKAKDLVRDALISDGSGNIKVIISQNKHAIGFISFEYLDQSVKALEVDNVKATAENVIESRYPISRGYLMVVDKTNLSDIDTKFIEWILSDNGQDLVQSYGSIKIR